MAVGPPPESGELIKSDDQSSEDGRKGKKIKAAKSSFYICEVTCLDGSIVKADVEKTAKGEVLFNKVVEELAICEREYVGLSFKNEKGIRLWLDIHKDMKHQIGDFSNDVPFQFRLKFYEPEPSRIQDAFLRYLFYLQMREDIMEGRLKCHDNTYAILGSYTAQAEIGDFNLHTHDHDYLSDYVFAPDQTSDLVKRVHELHKEHRGQSPAQAEVNFLEVAKKIPRYGVDVHKAKDNEGDVEIGVAAIGLYVYRDMKKEYLFRWQVIDAVLYNRRKYTVKLKEAVPKSGEESANEDAIKAKKKPQLTYIYYFDSATKCKQCYKSSVEWHTFFRLARPDAPRKKADTLKIGSSFRYSDRTLYQLRHRPKESPGADVPFTRTPSKRRSTNTPRGSWNPDDEHLKADRDAARLENGLPFVDEEPIQYEEIEIDEANPDDEKFDPEEWEVIEKKLPDGTLKRYRRRVIPIVPAKKKRSSLNDTPLISDPYFMDLDIPVMNGHHKVPVTEDAIVQEDAIQAQSAPVDFEEPPIAMYMEEVEIDENNPEDTWYDPSEWDVVERTMPDGTKKRFRVRMVEAETPDDENLAVVVEHEPMEMEEVEMDENDPEDANYDPKEWDVVEKMDPDGTKKRFRRRYLITRVNVVPRKTENSLIDEPLMQVVAVEMDEAHPETFNPDEWEVADIVTPAGEKKRIRRTILITRINVVPKKPSEIDTNEPLGIVEEVDVDEANPNDAKYDPNQWEVVEKTMPDGRKKPVRRRVLVTRVQFVNKKPSEVLPDEPLAVVEEVAINQHMPEPFDSNEWDVVEKATPDGTTTVPVRRRVLITRINYIRKEAAEISENESFAVVEEIDEDDEEEVDLTEVQEEFEYDPSEWEMLEKKLPNGRVIPVRRRVVITRVHTVNKKPSEVPPETPLTELEEVIVDGPDDNRYDPSEWELGEKLLPDGTMQPVRRRMVVTRVEYIHKKPSDLTADEQPVADLEEVEINPDKPDPFDPNGWEVVGITTPDGKQKQVRRRHTIRRVHVTHKKPSEVPAKERRARVEEVEIDESDPADHKYDPNQWEIVEKTSPGCMGKVKRVRRRIVMTQVNTIHKLPSELADQDPLKEAIEGTTDPKEWEVAKIPIAPGKEKIGRRRFLVPRASKEYKRPSEVPPQYPLVEVEEKEITPQQLEEQKYNPDEWDVLDKLMPDGTTKPVLKRYKVHSCTTEYKKPCDVPADVPIAEVEEVEIDPVQTADTFSPAEWDIGEKVFPDGTKKPIRRRYLVSCRQVSNKKPQAVSVPHVIVEEALINDDKYDPAEWDVVEKMTPDGECKRYRCRIKVTKVAKVYFKPSTVSTEDEPNATVEEVDMDEAHPENNVYDPKEWEVVEKILPDGSKKRVRRRYVVTRVEVVLKKPSELSSDEPEGIAVEEVPLDDPSQPDVAYDPQEWEVLEKTAPDGTKQRVRRRIVVKCTTTQKKPFIADPYSKPHIPIVVEEAPMMIESSAVVECAPDIFRAVPGKPRTGKKVIRQRSIKTTITPVGGRSVSVSTEEVPKQTEEIEIDESDPQDYKYDPKEWEVVERRLPDGSVKRYRHRVMETVITTVNKKYNNMLGDGAPVRMEEFEIDDEHPDNRLDSSECEILEKTLPDGTHKRYSRRIISSALPGSEKENEAPALWEEVEIDESCPDDEKFDPEEWEVLEKTLPDGSKKRFRRRNLNVITVHKKPIAITAGDAPLRVQEVEINEDVDQEINLDDWELVEKTMPNGRKKKFHRKILTTIFSSLNEKNEMIENPPIHIEEVEIYEVDSDEDDDDAFSPTEWKIVEKICPDGTTTQVRSRSSTTVITPKDTMKLEDKTVDEAPITAEEIPLDESSVHDHHFDPDEWDIIERKLPDGTTKRFHRRIIRKYKKISNSNPNLIEPKIQVQEAPVEEYEVDESNPEELKKYNPSEWEIVEKTMPDGTVKRFRRKIITTVVTTVTTKTIVVHPDGTEEVVDVETTPGEETTLESIDGLETVTENFMKNLHPEEEPVIQPLLEDQLESGVDFDMDNLLSEIDEISKSLSDDEARMSESDPVRANLAQKRKDEAKLKKLEAALDEEESRYKEKRREEDLRRLKEEERRQDDHNATISSIFTMDDADYSERGDSAYDESLTSLDDEFEFASADVDDGKVRTASVLKQKKYPKGSVSSEDDPKKVLSLDRRYLNKGGKPEVHPRSNSALPRVSTSEEVIPRCHSSAGVEQGDVYQQREGGGAEILYTVRDVSDVEQGQGGFVQSIKARHEGIAHHEHGDIQRDSSYVDDCHLPKGLVHTHSVSYHGVKEPETYLTKNPPSVTGVPTTIYPATSELPEEEIVYEISQSPVECHPDLLSDMIDMKIPEVKTQSVIFEEKPSDDVKFVRDPGVETRIVQIVPVTESYTMQQETIHDVNGIPEYGNANGRCQLTTYTMPTEVITKTITVEGDSSTMSREELQDIIRRSGSNENILDDPNVSSTHVVSTTTVRKVITGQTITVIGDDEGELQKAIDEAVKNATACENDVDDDGTIVLTAVQQYDEEGNIVATDLVGDMTEGDIVIKGGTEI